MSGSTVLLTTSSPFRKVRSVNATDTSFPSKIPTTTEPGATAEDAGTATGASIIPLVQFANGQTQNSGVFVPYCLGDDNDEFSMRVIGWRKIEATGVLTLWVPTLLCEVACIGCAATGIAGSAVLNTERFCDTITLVYGNDDISIDIMSPGGTSDVVAHFVLAMKGFTKIECTFDSTTGAPTSMNSLLALL